MPFRKLALAFALFASPALGQTYPSPTFANTTFTSSLYLNACTGYVYGNGTSAATCATSIPNSALPAGIAYTSAANTWSSAQTMQSNLAVTGNITASGNVAVNGTVTTGACTGYFYGNGASAATCATTIPAGALPTGTSGATIPLLNGANTWSAAQTFAGVTVNNNAAITGTLSWGGHAWGSGTAPTVSACGTTPALSTGANDTHGTVTVGTGGSSSCTITWASARTNAPDCAVTSPGGTAVSSYVPSTTTLVINFSLASSVKFTYVCLGQ